MAIFLWFSYGFPIKTSIFLWFSYGFPIKTSIFLWFSYGFPMNTSIFLWFSYGFPMFFLRAKISTVTRSTGPHPIGLTCAGAGFAAGGAALVAMPAVGLSEALMVIPREFNPRNIESHWWERWFPPFWVSDSLWSIKDSIVWLVMILRVI